MGVASATERACGRDFRDVFREVLWAGGLACARTVVRAWPWRTFASADEPPKTKPAARRAAGMTDILRTGGIMLSRRKAVKPKRPALSTTYAGSAYEVRHVTRARGSCCRVCRS